MEPLYYDVNFLRKHKLEYSEIIKILTFLKSFSLKMKIYMVQNVSYNNINNHILRDTDYQEKTIFIDGFIDLEDEFITGIYITLNHDVKLNIHFGFYEEYCQMTLFYTIENYMTDVFFYIWQHFYSLIDIFDPDIISMWETTIPHTIEEIKKGFKDSEYVYLKKRYIDLELLKWQKDLVCFSELQKWVLLFRHNESFVLPCIKL